MPKSRPILPHILQDNRKIRFAEVPVFAYRQSCKNPFDGYSRRELTGLYRDMCVIRSFETALKDVKEQGAHGGIEVSFHGPAHLSIGQEAVAVGMAFALKDEDKIFGSHRSHGEVIARALRQIATLDPAELEKRLQSFRGGCLFAKMSSVMPQGSLSARAELTFLYGMFAEIFARKDGFHGGTAGGMHVFFPPFGCYPNNAIVGASAPIAAGAALFNKVNGKPGVVVASVGDGAAGCGVVYEAMNFAAMAQYDELWEEKGKLPVIFHFVDNGYGMGGQTMGETMAYDRLVRLGAIAEDGFLAERIDGNDLFAVIDCFRRKRRRAEQGNPVLIDSVTYRTEGHSVSDRERYRTQEEVGAWQKQDPLARFGAELLAGGIADEKELAAIKREASEAVERAFRYAVDPSFSPYRSDRDYLTNVTFSDRIRQFDDADQTYPATARSERIASKKRIGEGSLTIADALYEGVIQGFCRDKTLISYGEVARDWGGIAGVYEGLDEVLPYRRLFNSPVSEAAMVSVAVGYAMCGGGVIVDMMFSDFMARAGDEIFNQLAKWQAIGGGLLQMPVVLRVMVGNKYGTQHSQEWTGLVGHIPGLKVVYPVTPYDAKGLLNAALKGSDPVVFFESQKLYNMGERFCEVPREAYDVALGKPALRREGRDITILTVGASLYPALESAEMLSRQGIEAEVIDARSIVPFDYDPVVKSVNKTGRLLIAGESVTQGSILNEFAVQLTAACFAALKAPPKVLGARNTVAPPCEYADDYYPTAKSIAAQVLELTKCPSGSDRSVGRKNQKTARR